MKIFASGALAKFIDARDHGASRQELMRLKTAAEAEVGSNRRRAGTAPSAGLAPPGKPPSKTALSEAPVAHRSNVLELLEFREKLERARLERERLEKSWEGAPGAS